MVILVTAYPEHALEGFDLDVVDYLLKPVPFRRFLKAVDKAHGLFKAINAQKHHLPEDDYVFVNANYSLVKIKIQDITYIEGLKDYVKIHLCNDKPVVTRMGLKGLDERLGQERFLRIHKSFIVALRQIQSIQRSHLIVRGTEIPIGAGYREIVHGHVRHKNLSANIREL